MVFLSRILWRKIGDKRVRTNFVDNVRVYVRGGTGGQGLPKFGGQGGQGGSVYVVADEVATLKQLLRDHPEKRFVAASGINSMKKALLGSPGQDLEINVPPGVCVKNDVDRVLGEVNTPGERVLVAKGGLGGCKETNFIGEKGHRQSIRLDLKLIADVGLVGFPNAGKSTLLKAVSRTSPKIASYPFTTVRPQIGVMQYEDQRQISIADLPGLIEGAHINIGMGHRFLKHVERTKLLLFMVDIAGFCLSQNHPARSSFETIILLNKELELYKEELVSKPAILALNKIDVEGYDDEVENVIHKVRNIKEHAKQLDPKFIPKTLVKFDDILPISAKKGTGIDELKNRIRLILDQYADINDDHSKELVQLEQRLESQLREHMAVKRKHV